MFRPHEFGQKVRFFGTVPVVYVSPEAFRDMAIITKQVSTEVGWMGSVTRFEDGDFLINEIFLIKQEVHATTTEITAQGMAEFTTKILEERPDEAMDILNSIRLWGHSHVNMGTSPSSQDNDQMKVFTDSCDDYFIRLIVNKKGRMEFKIYLIDQGIEIEDAEWVVWDDEDVTEHEERWKAEIKDKVSSLTYTHTNQNYQNSYWDSKEKKWVEREKIEDTRHNTGPDKSPHFERVSGRTEKHDPTKYIPETQQAGFWGDRSDAWGD